MSICTRRVRICPKIQISSKLLTSCSRIRSSSITTAACTSTSARHLSAPRRSPDCQIGGTGSTSLTRQGRMRAQVSGITCLRRSSLKTPSERRSASILLPTLFRKWRAAMNRMIITSSSKITLCQAVQKPGCSIPPKSPRNRSVSASRAALRCAQKEVSFARKRTRRPLT